MPMSRSNESVPDLLFLRKKSECNLLPISKSHAAPFGTLLRGESCKVNQATPADGQPSEGVQLALWVGWCQAAQRIARIQTRMQHIFACQPGRWFHKSRHSIKISEVSVEGLACHLNAALACLSATQQSRAGYRHAAGPWPTCHARALLSGTATALRHGRK